MSEDPIQELREASLALVERSQFMPAMSIELAVERYNTIIEFVSRVLRRDIDYGMIPGTDKLTLLKPGAEKLTTFFGLSTRFQLVQRIEDWTGEDHDDEPFFYYMYRCQLFRGELLIAEADASCNSRETKYRYREAQRLCPECKQAAIIKGKEQFGGGWLCFKKKGGCGAKFLIGDPVIESQQVGRVPNAEIADQVNTIQKMSQKRALIAATLLAVNASEFFTQDIEDMAINAPAVVTPAASFSEEEPSRRAGEGSSSSHQTSARVTEGAGLEAIDRIEDEILAACRLLGRTEDDLVEWLRKKYVVDRLGELTPAQHQEVLSLLNNRVARRRVA